MWFCHLFTSPKVPTIQDNQPEDAVLGDYGLIAFLVKSKEVWEIPLIARIENLKEKAVSEIPFTTYA